MNHQQQSVHEQLANKVLSVQPATRCLVAVNGKDASGKTMFADALATYLQTKTSRQVIRINIDDFMNERSIRRTPSSSEGESCYRYTINFDLFKRYVLEPLQPRGTGIYKTKAFDYDTNVNALSEDATADTDAIAVIDGVFLFREDLVDYWTLKVLIEVDDEIVIERGAKRDTERIGDYNTAKHRYINRYVASQRVYYKECNPTVRADIVINNNDYLTPRVEG